MEQHLSSRNYMKEETFPFHILCCKHDHANTPRVHGHDFVELVYLVRGEARHCFENEAYEISAGDVFIINPGEKHTYSIEPNQSIEIINCLFMPELIQESLLKELGISQSMDFFYVHPFLDQKERFHHRLNCSGRDASRVLFVLEEMLRELEMRAAGYRTMIRIQLIELLIMLSRLYNHQQLERQDRRTPRQKDQQLLCRRINGYLERHFDKKLSAASICELFNISNRQLNRVFKNETGFTLMERIHHIRIERAKQILREGDDKIVHIAYRVGYEDPAFFSRLFRRQVGYSPGQYRKQL